jgi:hypothetical protein
MDYVKHLDALRIANGRFARWVKKKFADDPRHVFLGQTQLV